MKKSAIYTLSIACVGGRFLTEEFRFVIEIPADWSLGDLALEILDRAEFDGDHLSEFYLSTGLRAKKRTTLAAGRADEDSPMDGIRLLDVFPLAAKQVLYYEYDPGDNWCFEIIKQGPDTSPQKGIEYPRVVEEHGNKPVEYGPDEDEDEEDDVEESNS